MDSLASSDATTIQQPTYDLMELYYHVAVIITDTYGAAVESVFDKHRHGFEAIVDLADILIREHKNISQDYGLLFSFDLGITPPMFLVASRCRHPRIRRRAVELMIQPDIYHGAWRGGYSAACAQRMIEIEEQDAKGAPQFMRIPEHQRIRKVSADIQQGIGRILMQYIRAPFTEGSPICTTVIPWNDRISTVYTKNCVP